MSRARAGRTCPGISTEQAALLRVHLPMHLALPSRVVCHGYDLCSRSRTSADVWYFVVTSDRIVLSWTAQPSCTSIELEGAGGIRGVRLLQKMVTQRDFGHECMGMCAAVLCF